ncbi:MAG: hypothetical protein AB1414_05080 [bacterium]
MPVTIDIALTPTQRSQRTRALQMTFSYGVGLEEFWVIKDAKVTKKK